MAEKFYQFLRPGERVLYCQPTVDAGWLWHAAGGFGLAVLGPLTDPGRAGLTIFLGVLLVLVGSRAIALSQYGGGVEAAVTDRRVLRVEGEDPAPRMTDIATDQVESIEVLGRALRVTQKNGRVVILDQLSHAPEVGLALALAADAAPPWVPSPKDRLAEELVVLAACCTSALAYALTLGAQGSGTGEAIPLLARGPLVTLGLVMGVTGGLLGLLSGLASLKPHFTRDGMRAWMRQSDIFAPKPQPGARTGRFTTFCLHFVDFLYGPPSGPLDQGQTDQES